MKSYETKFGTLEIEEKDIILFEFGIPGFEELKKFYILNLEETNPILWLVSLENKDISFPVIPPTGVRIDYSYDISQDIVDYLELKKPEDVFTLSILTIREKKENITINLAAPILISLVNNKALQYILENFDYNTEHSFNDEIKRSASIVSTEKGGD